MSDNYVQSGANTGTTTVAVTLTGVVAGNTLVAFLGDGTTSGPGTHTASSNNGGSLTAGGTATDSGDAVWFGCFTLPNANSGSHTVTGTLDSGNGAFMIVAEIGSTAGASSVTDTKAVHQSAPGTGTDALSSGTVTISAASTLVAFSADTASASTSDEPAAGTGFTSRVNAANGTIGAYRLTTKALSSSAAATFTAITGGDQFITFGVSVLNAAGGGPVTVGPVGGGAATGGLTSPTAAFSIGL